MLTLEFNNNITHRTNKTESTPPPLPSKKNKNNDKCLQNLTEYEFLCLKKKSLILQRHILLVKDTASPRSLHKLASAYFFISIQHWLPTEANQRSSQAR